MNREELLEMICCRCVVAWQARDGEITEEEARAECDTCPCAAILREEANADEGLHGGNGRRDAPDPRGRAGKAERKETLWRIRD